jgi:hypothetical protein
MRRNGLHLKIPKGVEIRCALVLYAMAFVSISCGPRMDEKYHWGEL